ncbi:potassium transporter Kup [Devosia sp. CN2-171]|uniref:potassium transporter Kup n=1 Tax=Devosia sp. CN2-171 TaxID=3400909 RepID=UPI003BF8D73C
MAPVNNTSAQAGAVLPENDELNRGLPVLVMGAIGVVYGDIGTSPLYAFREAMHVSGGAGGGVDSATVLGILSLIVWTLIILVTGKYIGIVLRADNKGEGGTLSLMALAQASFKSRPTWVLTLGVVGAALFYGDAMITPAISVLSAIEGVRVVAPNLDQFIIPATIVVIIGLFAVQRFGTSGVAAVFGPITVIWFLAMGGFGLMRIVEDPAVLAALNPLYGVNFIGTHTGIAAATFGAVFLAVTGAEALYADLGHFGRRPIIIAWFALVFPCLLLNYFGQAAYVLEHGEAVENPFYQMLPDWSQVPMVLLATAATVIASQAVITGAFSLTRQAVSLNILPRMTVLHTSATQHGQIYMPLVNGLLMIAVVLLVLGFGSSSHLGAAYGIAVTGEMLVTVALLVIVMIRIWRWQPWMIALVVVPIGIIELIFFSSNAAKFFQGGWVPVLVALTIAATIAIWIVGRTRLAEKTRRDEVPLQFLVENLSKKKPAIVPGTAVFLTSDIEGAPTALLHSLKHYKVLHEHNVILTVVTSSAPRVADDEKVTIDAYNDLFYRVVVTFGYMETPNIPKALALARKLGWKFDIMSTSFFLSRRSLKPSPKGGMPLVVDRIFIALARNATDATEYFHIPTGRVVEIGTQVVI